MKLDQPLSGKCILVTRASDQATELVNLLVAQGAEPIEAPTIRIMPPEDYGPLDKACATAGLFDWIVFTSVNGVEYFMQRLLERSGNISALNGVRLCAIGPATAERLNRHGIKVDLMPPEHRAEAVFDSMQKASNLAGEKVLLPRADLAREVLANELRNAGAKVTEVTAYRTILASDRWKNGPNVSKLLLERRVDVVTFTSASTVRNFVQLLGSKVASELLETTLVASIGPITANAAQQLRIKTSIMPVTYTIPALVEKIVDYFEATKYKTNN